MKSTFLPLAAILSSALHFPQSGWAQNIRAADEAGGVRTETAVSADDTIPKGKADPRPEMITNPGKFRDDASMPMSNPAINQSYMPEATAPDTSASTTANPGMLAGILGACTAFLGSMFGSNNTENAKNIDDVSNAVDRMNDSYGNLYEKDYSEDQQRNLGRDAAAHLGKGCTNFVDKDGKPGPWGRDALILIKQNPKSYAENEPADLVQMCPGYKNMEAKERELLWLWVFSAISSSEAGCDPAALNPYSPGNPNSPPNGNAIGLFQLEPKSCDGKSEKTLYDPHENTRCAVRVLAAEMTRRTTLLDYRKDTYWGPLRGNTKHRGDANGGARMKLIIPKFNGCKK